MLPWVKNYLDKEFAPRPKTIFFGPEGLDVIDLSRLLVKLSVIFHFKMVNQT